jgi:hypothetical protein
MRSCRGRLAGDECDPAAGVSGVTRRWKIARNFSDLRWVMIRMNLLAFDATNELALVRGLPVMAAIDVLRAMPAA